MPVYQIQTFKMPSTKPFKNACSSVGDSKSPMFMRVPESVLRKYLKMLAPAAGGRKPLSQSLLRFIQLSV